MGQISSQEEKKHDGRQVKVLTIDQSIGADNYSSYRGIKSADSKNKDTTAGTKSNIKYEVKVPTHFEWNEGGKSVYLACSFSNWSQWFVMNKIDNKFEINLVRLLNTGITERCTSI